jgi:hypothetical protein
MKRRGSESDSNGLKMPTHPFIPAPTWSLELHPGTNPWPLTCGYAETGIDGRTRSRSRACRL